MFLRGNPFVISLAGIRSSLCQQLRRAAGVLLLVVMPLSGCSDSQKEIPGLKNFHVGVAQDYFFLSFLAPSLQSDFGITLPIPGLHGATVSLQPDLQSMGSVFQFTAPMSSIAGHSTFYPESGLPDSRPLPDIAGGKLPRWDLEITKRLTASFYLSDQAFGIFVPLVFSDGTSIAWPWQMSATFNDERGNRLGKIYLIPSNLNGLGSGLFILLPGLAGGSASLK